MSNKQEDFCRSARADYVKLKNLVYRRLQVSIGACKQEIKSSLNEFSIAGYCPCYVKEVTKDSSAELNGIKRGDLLIEINAVNCYRATVKTINSLLKPVDGKINLTIYRRLKNSEKAYQISKILSDEKKKFLKPLINKKIKNSKNGSLISKWLRPSLWLSCAQPTNTTIS
ncbi:hypothetical protein BpHYR1_045905, partial [Brachionus plicatilis]